MKTFHQLISNFRVIAELFIVPARWLKYFATSLKSLQVVVFYEFMSVGGG